MLFWGNKIVIVIWPMGVGGDNKFYYSLKSSLKRLQILVFNNNNMSIFDEYFPLIALNHLVGIKKHFMNGPKPD